MGQHPSIAIELAPSRARRSLSRWGRPVAFGITALILVGGAAIAVARWNVMESRGLLGIDYTTFIAFAQRWLDTGSMYQPYQLAGPYDPRPFHNPATVPSVYPPHALFLFVPLLILPSILWWAIPLGLIAFGFFRWRPSALSWPVLGAIVALPDTVTPVLSGSTTMWIAAFVAAGLMWGWPSLLVTLKPSLGPLFVIGIQRRVWWVAAVALAVVNIPLWHEWLDYATVARNAVTDWTYSVPSIPIVIAPLIVWLARRDADVRTFRHRVFGSLDRRHMLAEVES